MLKQYLFWLAIVIQATASRISISLGKRPQNILVRPMTKPKPIAVEYNAFAPIRGLITGIGKPFSVEKNSTDPESINAEQRLVQLKRQLISNNKKVQDSGIDELHQVIEKMTLHAGRSHTYNYSEAIVNICHILYRNMNNSKKATVSIKVEPMLVKLLCHVKTFPEFYYITTNNHLLNNARALIMGGIILRRGYIVSSGISLLHHSMRIFDKNGIFRERSSHYHLLIFLWMQDIFTALSQIEFQGKKKLHNSLQQTMQKNLALSLAIANHCKLGIPLIGDVSPDEPPIYTKAHFLLQHPTLPHTAHGWQQHSEWFIYRNFHWSIIACLNTRIYSLYPAHNHDDWGSFCLAGNGEEILIDPGRYSYAKDRISQHQISRRAHNSICIEVNGKTPQTNRIGRIKYITQRKVYSEAQQLILIEHFKIDGTCGTWKRTVSPQSQSVDIIDTISVSGPAQITCGYNFNKEWLSQKNNEFILTVNDIETVPIMETAEYCREYLNKTILERAVIKTTTDTNIKIIGRVKCVG